MKTKTKKNKLINRVSRVAICLTVSALLIASCEELPIGQTPTDKVAPPPLTNVVARAIPGGAVISYKIPATDKDISYVKADYRYKDKDWTARSSVYTDSLLIEGFAIVEPVEVTLAVVDHSENVSEPVIVSFTPETPPIDVIFNSVELNADFGGVNVTWINTTHTEIGVTVLYQDSLGNFIEGSTQFSTDEKGQIIFRGFEAVETVFAVRIRDKWGNESGQKEATVIPIVEKLLDKSKFITASIPGDNTSIYGNQPYRAFFDGSYTSLWVSDITDFSWSYPMYVSIDMGVTATLSRFRLWGQPGFYYNNYGFRIFTVWGTDEVNRSAGDEYWSSGEWKNDWVKIDDYVCRRPSGVDEPTGSPTGVDLEAAQAGWEFAVQPGTPAVRYIRFEVFTIWSSGTGLAMAECSFWGNDGSE